MVVLTASHRCGESCVVQFDLMDAEDHAQEL